MKRSAFLSLALRRRTPHWRSCYTISLCIVRCLVVLTTQENRARKQLRFNAINATSHLPTQNISPYLRRWRSICLRLKPGIMDGAYEAACAGKFAFGRYHPPPDVTRADIWRGCAAFTFVYLSPFWWIFVASFLRSEWGGAAVVAGLLVGSYILSCYNTGSELHPTGFYIRWCLLIFCIAKSLV